MTNYRMVYESKDALHIFLPVGSLSIDFSKAAESMGVKEYHIVNINNLPSNREFRTSWRYNKETGKVEESLEAYKSRLERLSLRVNRGVTPEISLIREALTLSELYNIESPLRVLDNVLKGDI